MCNWSVIHGIKRKPHLSVVWNWYHWVAIAILHQPRPTDSADINTRLQLSDTSSIPPMHGGFLLVPATLSKSLATQISMENTDEPIHYLLMPSLVYRKDPWFCTLRLRQNINHFRDVFKLNFVNGKCCTSIKISFSLFSSAQWTKN